MLLYLRILFAHPTRSLEYYECLRKKKPYGHITYYKLFLLFRIFIYLICYLKSMFTIAKRLIYIDNKKT